MDLLIACVALTTITMGLPIFSSFLITHVTALFFQVPGLSSRTDKSKEWEPSTAGSDDEDCVELEVSLKLI